MTDSTQTRSADTSHDGNDRPADHHDHGYSFVTLDPPGASSTNVEATNNPGEVAGTYIDSSGRDHGFIYDNGNYTTIGAPGVLEGEPPGAFGTYAHAINNRGEVAGHYIDSSGAHGYVYDNGAFTTFDVPGLSATLPSAINDRGEVVGYGSSSDVPGFIYDNGAFTTLVAPGAVTTLPDAINNRGEIAGYQTASTLRTVSSPPQDQDDP